MYNISFLVYFWKQVEVLVCFSNLTHKVESRALSNYSGHPLVPLFQAWMGKVSSLPSVTISAATSDAPDDVIDVPQRDNLQTN